LESGKIVEGNILDTFYNIRYVEGSVGGNGNGGSNGGDDCIPSCNNQADCCSGKECGTVDDGCGTNYNCGDCSVEEFCANNICRDGCVIDCAGKECGFDGCDGLCGVCDDGYYCSDGICVEGGCVANCSGKQCGDDGCGGLCGICSNTYGEGYVCVSGICYCDPDCAEKECGDNRCGGSCGNCIILYGEDYVCSNGTCVYIPSCVPNTCQDLGYECGTWLDGCGGSLNCGTCDLGEGCTLEGLCVPEVFMNNGTIYSVWPSESKIYFDSNDLPKESGLTFQSDFVRFPESEESRCISIVSFITPSIPEIYNMSYIELGIAYSNINVGDKYEIWDTLEGCTYN
jgi:hypothetical protein